MDEYLHILLTTLQHDIAFFLRSMTLFIVHVFFLQFTCSTIHMEDTGQSKMRQTFWSFRGFRTKYTGLELECHPGFFKVFQD